MEKVDVLFATASVSRIIGCIYTVEKSLALHFTRMGINDDVVSLVDDNTDNDLKEWLPLRPTSFAVNGPGCTGVLVTLKGSCKVWPPWVIFIHYGPM